MSRKFHAQFALRNQGYMHACYENRLSQVVRFPPRGGRRRTNVVVGLPCR